MQSSGVHTLFAETEIVQLCVLTSTHNILSCKIFSIIAILHEAISPNTRPYWKQKRTKTWLTAYRTYG